MSTSPNVTPSPNLSPTARNLLGLTRFLPLFAAASHQVLGVSTSPDVTPSPNLLQGPAYGLNITGSFGAGSAVEVVVSLQGNVAADQVGDAVHGLVIQRYEGARGRGVCVGWIQQLQHTWYFAACSAVDVVVSPCGSVVADRVRCKGLAKPIGRDRGRKGRSMFRQPHRN